MKSAEATYRVADAAGSGGRSGNTLRDAGDDRGAVEFQLVVPIRGGTWHINLGSTRLTTALAATGGNR
jgi:hypothetical protein